MNLRKRTLSYIKEEIDQTAFEGRGPLGMAGPKNDPRDLALIIQRYDMKLVEEVINTLLNPDQIVIMISEFISLSSDFNKATQIGIQKWRVNRGKKKQSRERRDFNATINRGLRQGIISLEHPRDLEAQERIAKTS